MDFHYCEEIVEKWLNIGHFIDSQKNYISTRLREIVDDFFEVVKNSQNLGFTCFSLFVPFIDSIIQVGCSPANIEVTLREIRTKYPLSVHLSEMTIVRMNTLHYITEKLAKELSMKLQENASSGITNKGKELENLLARYKLLKAYLKKLEHPQLMV